MSKWGNVQMNDAMANYHYKQHKEMMLGELDELKEYSAANEILMKNGWFFVCPLFFRGFELHYISKLNKDSTDQRKSISDLITRKFYNLEYTASFVDGYCSRCTYIEPFLLSIEHSIALAFQRDYEGAIKTIIPIFEGILRQYLIAEHGMENKGIKFEHLKKSFSHIKAELIAAAEERFRNDIDENNRPINLSFNQIKQLVQYETEYFTYWFSFITDFVEGSFYMNTQTKIITDEFNRHAILHEYGLGTEYTLENYLKAYMSIQFLVWIFLKKENKSLLDQIDNFRFFEKVTLYETIIKESQKLSYSKHMLYAPYKGYNMDTLQKKYPISTLNLPKMLRYRHKILSKLDEFFWKRRLR